MPCNIDLAETQGVLLAGRRIPSYLTVAQAAALMRIADEFDPKLPSETKLRLAAVPSGDFTNAPEDDETCHDDLLIGHRSVTGCANDMGPIGPYSLEQLREVVERGKAIPEEFWQAIAKTLDADDAEKFLAQPITLWMTSTGPLCMGLFAYGVRMSRDEAEKRHPEAVYGCTQGYVEKLARFDAGASGADEDGGEEDAYDEDADDDFCDEDADGDFLESQMPHDEAVAGWSIQVAYDGNMSEPIDLSDEAHAERARKAEGIPGDKGYYVIGHYD